MNVFIDNKTLCACVFIIKLHLHDDVLISENESSNKPQQHTHISNIDWQIQTIHTYKTNLIVRGYIVRAFDPLNKM